jgi:hypothetical protein
MNPRVMVVATTLALGACAHDPSDLQGLHDVPVQVSCVDKRPKKPQFYTDDEIKAMDDYKVVYALRRDRDLAKKYMGELEDTVSVCERAPSVVTVPR